MFGFFTQGTIHLSALTRLAFLPTPTYRLAKKTLPPPYERAKVCNAENLSNKGCFLKTGLGEERSVPLGPFMLHFADRANRSIFNSGLEPYPEAGEPFRKVVAKNSQAAGIKNVNHLGISSSLLGVAARAR